MNTTPVFLLAFNTGKEPAGISGMYMALPRLPIKFPDFIKISIAKREFIRTIFLNRANTFLVVAITAFILWFLILLRRTMSPLGILWEVSVNTLNETFNRLGRSVEPGTREYSSS